MALVLIAAVVASVVAQSGDVEKLARPSAQQVVWHDCEVGMFVHIAPQTWQDDESDRMDTPLTAIDPSKLDTEQWVRVAESMGAKYLVFVAKHEGGFCWWPTATTEYSVKSTPWRGGKGDVVADLAKSCKARGIRLGLYLSPQDRKFGAAVGGKCADASKQKEYETRFRAQLKELLTGYGDIFEIWFDGSLVFDVGDLIDAHAKDAIVFQGPRANIRWVGNEEGIAPDPSWNGAKFDAKTWGTLTAADGTPDGDRWLPSECDARIRSTWFWKTNNEKTLKSVDKLMEMYEKSVGRGGVLLLNHTPDRSGLIPEGDVKRAAEFGAEVKRRYETAIVRTSGKGMTVQMQPSAPMAIDRVVTMEEISLGERVREYVVEGQVDGEWKELCRGTAIGHKKIDAVAVTKVGAVRLRVVKAVGEPQIRSLAVYRVGK